MTGETKATSALERMRSALAAQQKRDDVRIDVGSMAVFGRWCERLGPTIKIAPHETPPPPSFMGVPVRVSEMLPERFAFVVVNGELTSIIEIEEAPAGRLALSDSKERGE